jgi:thimet oligopeptidase
MKIFQNIKNLNIDLINKFVIDIKDDVTQTLDQIVNLKENRTFENTVQPHINVNTLITPKYNCFSIIFNFYPDKDLRDAAVDAIEEVDKFNIEANMRKDVYNSFLNYEANMYQEEKDKLTHEERRYVEHTIRDFKRNGLHLEGNDFEQLKEWKKTLSELETKYNKNINEENTVFEFTKTQLEGMPSSWFTEDKVVEGKEDTYKFTLKYPDVIPGGKYIKDECVRKQIWEAFNNRCANDNTPLFEEAVKLRYYIANLLGYNTHADYETELKIVKNGDTALDFLNNLNRMFTPLYEKDIGLVTEFAKSYEPNPLTKSKMDQWDFNFYIRAYQEKVCDFDMEEVKKYFPINIVKDGIFKIYQHILGLTFREIETDNKWHNDVNLYEVTDNDTGEVMGHFYLDMYPREGKFSHAAVFSFINSYEKEKVTGEKWREPCLVSMACNFPKNDCLSFDEVESFFHEFGHVMHQICNRSQLECFTGFNIEGDFIEAPSQMLEYWCYCKEPLQMISSHKETGEPIPEDIIQKLNTMKKVLNGYLNKIYLVLGLFDLKAHTMKFNENTSFDSLYLWYQNEKEILNFESSLKVYRMANFGHLMDGYDAGYYGYLRSETYAANMFYKMFKNDPLNQEMGRRYRDKLLAPGSTSDGINLLRDFLGSEPDDSYFLLDKGLVV